MRIAPEFFRADPVRTGIFFGRTRSQLKKISNGLASSQFSCPSHHPTFPEDGQRLEKYRYFSDVKIPLSRSKTHRQNKGFFHFRPYSSGFDAICQRNTLGNTVFPGPIYTDLRRTEAKMGVSENSTIVFHHKMTSREVRQGPKGEFSDGESIPPELMSRMTCIGFQDPFSPLRIPS